MCCHPEIEVADQTFYLTQLQYTDTGPTSLSPDPKTPYVWQGSHWKSPQCNGKSNPGSAVLEADAFTTRPMRWCVYTHTNAFSPPPPPPPLPQHTHTPIKQGHKHSKYTNTLVCIHVNNYVCLAVADCCFSFLSHKIIAGHLLCFAFNQICLFSVVV